MEKKKLNKMIIIIPLIVAITILIIVLILSKNKTPDDPNKEEPDFVDPQVPKTIDDFKFRIELSNEDVLIKTYESKYQISDLDSVCNISGSYIKSYIINKGDDSREEIDEGVNHCNNLSGDIKLYNLDEGSEYEIVFELTYKDETKDIKMFTFKTYTEGDGSSESPFKVYDEASFYQSIDKDYTQLIKNITLERAFEGIPILNENQEIDGNNKRIIVENFTPANKNIGFVITNKGTIKDLDVIIEGGINPSETIDVDYVGGLVGHNTLTGVISNTSFFGNIAFEGIYALNRETPTFIGGLVGFNQGIIENSYTEGEIRFIVHQELADFAIGGIAGISGVCEEDNCPIGITKIKNTISFMQIVVTNNQFERINHIGGVVGASQKTEFTNNIALNNKIIINDVDSRNPRYGLFVAKDNYISGPSGESVFTDNYYYIGIEVRDDNNNDLKNNLQIAPEGVDSLTRIELEDEELITSLGFNEEIYNMIQNNLQ